MQSGVGWVPVNQTITAFDDIPECPHWGSHGDLKLIPDPVTRTRVDLSRGLAPLHFFLCNVVELDGLPWDLCARSFLRKTHSRFLEETGLRATAAFEHEFVLLRDSAARVPAFSYRAGRQAEPFASLFMTALEQAGQEPEIFLPEFAPNQYEITCAPSVGVGAADKAVIAREIAYDVANQLNQAVSFSPRPALDSVGNGVHVHISLQNEAGENALYSDAGESGISVIGGQFAAGILKYLPAILALTAPSVISFRRLVPHQWSAAYTCFGLQNREAALRICPVDRRSGQSIEQQYHFEFRAADATANPYLALGVILLAGLEGIMQKLPAPPLVNTDPHELSAMEKRKLNISRLPIDLGQALDMMQATAPVNTWFSPEFLDSYLAVKRSEMKRVENDDETRLCNRYREIY